MGILGLETSEACRRVTDLLLTAAEFRDTLSLRLSKANEAIIVFSAFTKFDALEWLISKAGTTNLSIITRWQPGDLASRASDLECYKLCKRSGVKFGISSGLHGKIYCTDRQILIGSANLTSRGLALLDSHNDEFGYGFEAGISDLSKLNRYLASVVWIDDDLFESIEAELSNLEPSNFIADKSWSKALRSKMQRPVDYLWVHELPLLEPQKLIANQFASNDPARHIPVPFELDTEGATLESLIEKFQDSRCFYWLCQVVRENGSLSFGSLTKELHNALMDDPTPYRREVKQLVANLLAWAGECTSIFKITRPRHSLVISLV